MNKEKIEELFEEFNQEFDTQIEYRRNKTPILMNMFQQFSDEIYRNCKIFKEATNKKQEIMELIKLNKNQRRLMEKYDELEYLILDDMVERGFLYGFLISKEIEKEKTNINNIIGNLENENS